MSVEVMFRKRRVPKGLWATVVLLIVSAAAWGLPDNPRDPPLPPSTFGNLFEDGSLAIHSCRILSNSGVQAVLNYTSTFPRTEVSYWQRTATWSTWQAITGSSYTCTSPNCLWGGAQVRIRGCDSSSVCYAPGCTIRLGVTAGGPPAVSPVALPSTASTVAGCAQTGHATVRFEARWIGAPSTGYPTAEDELGNSLALTQISRVTVGGVEVGTYTIPGSSSWADGDLWKFKFALASTRVTETTVQVRDNCLQPPVIEHVATGGVRVPLALGQQIQSTVNLELAVVSGNPLLGLTSPALSPVQAFTTPFSPPAVSSGNQLDLAWVEEGDAWDGLRYTSPPGTVQITGVPCSTGSAASYWITGSADINLNEDINWTNGPLVETDACTPVSPGAPVAGADVGVAVTWQAIAEGTGWRVQARAAQNLGLVSSTSDYSGGLWGSATALRALRSPPANCPAGERLIAGVCVPCVDYSACVGGSLVTQQHCTTGPAPTDATVASYQTCVGGITQTQQACLSPGDAAPVDAPCTLADCVTDERLVSGVCEPCPDYQVCSAGSLITDKYCGSGTPPGDAREVTYDSCVAGVTTAVTECVADGDPSPADSPCPACTPPAAGSETYELDTSAARVALPDSTDWVAAPSIRTNVCGGSPPSVNSTNSDARISFGAFIAEPGGGRWPIEVAAVQPGGEVDELFYWYSSSWNMGGSSWYFYAERGPLTCAAGEREVAGVCEVCPRHEACSSGVTVDRRYCGNGPAPADVPCVTSCPPTQRLVLGVCESCLTYWECSAGRRVQREHCGSGSPPRDARNETVRACVGGVQQTNTVCVAAGDPRPADTPCTSCPSGQRLVAGSCEPCVNYDVCTASVGDVDDWRNDAFLDSRTFCGAGYPPNSADMTLNFVCRSGTTRLVSHCIGTGGLSYDPGDVPCSGDTCYEYEACTADSRYSRPGLLTTTYRTCGSGTAPDPPQVYTRRTCMNQGTPTEYEETKYYCVGSGGLYSTGAVPADAPCGLTCENYNRCTGSKVHGMLGTESELLEEVEHCGPGLPPDAYTISRSECIGGSNYLHYFCIGEGGYSADPGDLTCPTCPSRQRMVGGSCEACPTHYVCNGNSRATEYWCDPGTPPGDARIVSFQSCVGGSNTTVNTCVGPYENDPADDPCPVSCGANQRPVNGVCEACPTHEVCSNGVTENRQHCGSGNPPPNRPCLEGGCLPTPKPACSTGQTLSWNQGTCVWDFGSVSAPSCQAGQQSTWDTSNCVYGPCQGCLAGQRSVGGSCEACPTYWACLGNDREERTWCYTGDAPDDVRVNTYQACVSGSTVDLNECLLAGETATEDDPCPTSCSTGQRMVNGICEECPKYWGCNGDSREERTWCNDGDEPEDSRINTYKACVSGVTVDRDECLLPGDDETADRPCVTSCPPNQRVVDGICVACPTYWGCSGDDRVRLTWCDAGPQPGNAWLANYQACESGVEVTRTTCVAYGVSGPADETPCCVDYKACSGTSLVTAQYCGSGTAPDDARLVTYACCINDANTTCTTCVAANVIVDPIDDPCPTCVDYQICSGNSLVPREYCGDSPPVSAYLHDYKVCSGGTLSTQTECIGSGDSETADAQTGEQTYCDSNAVEQIRDVCGSDSDITPSSCGPGETMNSDGCCPACVQPSAPPCTGPREGQAPEWNTASCRYDWDPVTRPSCVGTLRWEDTTCSWDCVILDITFSFPAQITEQTSAMTQEQSLVLSFDADGSITLVEDLSGPNSSRTVSLGNWATGSDVDQVSSLVEYRLALIDWGQCSMGSSSWSAFSGLYVGVVGEAAVGQTASSCNYEFRNSDTRASLGSSRIQLSTQSTVGSGVPGGITQ